jgi:peptide deformylase
MAVRDIISYFKDSDPLRKKCHPVQHIDKGVMALVNDLKDTLNAHTDGIGLAAPQINVHQRVVVVRLGGNTAENYDPGPPVALVNPKIIEAADERKDFDGCLSFPGLFGETIRPHYLRITGLDENGEPFNNVYDGFCAVVVHHEIDHLDGVLFIDRVGSIEDLYQVRKNEKGELVRVPIASSKL